MTDCPRGDLRDLLPDLLHGTLDEARRAEVEAHVAACADCRAELALLRGMRGALGRAPAVDTRRIAEAVVAARRAAPTVAMAPARVAPQAASWRVRWRAAAAIAAVAVGLGSYALARSGRTSDTATRVAVLANSTEAPVVQSPTREAAPAAVAPAPIRASTTVAQGMPPASAKVSAPAAQITPDGGVSDLSNADLEQLLQTLDTLTAVPDANPAQVAPELDPGDAGAL